MAALVIFIAIVAILAVLDVAAVRHGVDSRDGSVDRRRPVSPTGIAV